MPGRRLRSIAARPLCVAFPILMLCAFTLSSATRPQYGGALRIETRETLESADPPTDGHSMAQLQGGFRIVRWEAGRRAVYAADENAPGGRPYLDTVEVEMGRSLRDQSIDLELGKADVVELGAAEVRRLAGRPLWRSAPVRVMALVFGPRIEDLRIRQALALAVDRAAIHKVLLQQQGEPSGALLPQWLSGYAFVFSVAADLTHARALSGAPGVSPRAFTLGFDDASLRSIAERIALNARDAGLTVTLAAPASADVRLVTIRIASTDPNRALSAAAASLGLPEPAKADSPTELLSAERALLDGYRVVPLFHLPDAYGLSSRVKGGPGISPLGEWRFEGIWLEGKP